MTDFIVLFRLPFHLNLIIQRISTTKILISFNRLRVPLLQHLFPSHAFFFFFFCIHVSFRSSDLSKKYPAIITQSSQKGHHHQLAARRRVLHIDFKYMTPLAYCCCCCCCFWPFTSIFIDVQLYDWNWAINNNDCSAPSRRCFAFCPSEREYWWLITARTRHRFYYVYPDTFSCEHDILNSFMRDARISTIWYILCDCLRVGWLDRQRAKLIVVESALWVFCVFGWVVSRSAWGGVVLGGIQKMLLLCGRMNDGQHV